MARPWIRKWFPVGLLAVLACGCTAAVAQDDVGTTVASGRMSDGGTWTVSARSYVESNAKRYVCWTVQTKTAPSGLLGTTTSDGVQECSPLAKPRGLGALVGDRRCDEGDVVVAGYAGPRIVRVRLRLADGRHVTPVRDRFDGDGVHLVGFHAVLSPDGPVGARLLGYDRHAVKRVDVPVHASSLNC